MKVRVIAAVAVSMVTTGTMTRKMMGTECELHVCFVLQVCRMNDASVRFILYSRTPYSHTFSPNCHDFTQLLRFRMHTLSTLSSVFFHAYSFTHIILSVFFYRAPPFLISLYNLTYHYNILTCSAANHKLRNNNATSPP